MRIFLDENLSEFVADALNSLDRGYFIGIEVVSTKKAIRAAATDEEIIPKIGQEQGVLITRDYNIKKTRSKYQLCREHQIGVIFIRLPKNQNRHWEIVKVLIKHWEETISTCSSKKKPFALSADAARIETDAMRKARAKHSGFLLF